MGDNPVKNLKVSQAREYTKTWGFIKTTSHDYPATDPPTHRLLTTYPPTHQPLTHRPTDQLLLTYAEIEDQILNMFCIL